MTELVSDIIVLLPGITGSVLKKDGKTVWGFSGRVLGRTLLTGGSSLRDALLLKDDPSDLDDLGDGITADALFDDLHLIPKLWKIDGYGKVSDRIRRAFEIRDGENFFHLPYDWRRDNRVAARKLQRKANEWLHRWRVSSGNEDAKLILIAHSMGGLVSRYFLEVLEGWRDTRALVTFGTPFRGSLNALDTLANGVRKGPRGLIDLSELSRSFTSIYQLLPIYGCYDAGGDKLVRVAETDIPGVDRQRAEAALAFHREIEAAVDRHLDDEYYRENRYRMSPVIGIQQDTSQSAKPAGDDDDQAVSLIPSYKGKDQGGDGTVPRVSAIPIEYSRQNVGMFAATKHGSLQNADAVLAQLEGVITGMAIDLDAFRAGRTSLSLEVDDLYLESEPVNVRARPSRAGDHALSAKVVDETGIEVARQSLKDAGEGWFAAHFTELSAGAYRVRVEGADVEPASDAFAVADAEEAEL